MKVRTNFLVLSLFAFALFLGFLVSQPDASADSLRDQMIAKAKKERTVVLAGSIADDMKNGLKGFRKRYPFITIKDIAMNTKDTVNRVSAEAKAGQLSIDWAGISEDGSEIFVRQNILAKFDYPHLKDFVRGSQPPHGLYVGGMGNPRIQGAYNTDLISPKDAPKSWEEMGDPKWKGKTMLSRSSEEIPGRLAWLWQRDGKWDWERAFNLFRKLKAHNPVIGRGYSGGIGRVAAGEVAIFWFTPPSTAARLAMLKGAPLGLIAFPKFFGGLRAWNIFKDAPHPASAWLLMDYITSPEGQFEFTDQVGAFLPLNRKAKVGKQAKWIVERGGSVENMNLIDLSNVKEIYSDKVQKKSEQFYFKLLGLR